MFPCNSIYPLPRDGAFSAHINTTFPGTSLIMKKIGLNRQENPPSAPCLAHTFRGKQDLPLPDSE